MSLIYRILWAAHANGTHHKLALEGVRQLRCAEAEAWRRVFLAHAEMLLEGSKAPDKTFKDFQNHCLHISDDPGTPDWGGAERAAREWWRETVRALTRGAWDEAAYNAGVLSHYYTDPLMPFHTGSSEAESVIHRAAEWSVSKSFDRLWATAPEARLAPIDANADEWVAAMVRAGAEASRRHYQTLIDHYDFATGAKTPEKGFDETANAAIATLLAHAASGVARLFDRAIVESGAAAPSVNLTLKTVVAGLKIPARWVVNKLEDSADRREVAAIFAEFQETGRVEKTLPEENRVVRRLSREAKAGAPRHGASAEIEALRGALGEDRLAKRDAAQARRARPRLSRDAAVEKAPSIGPKTAERLAPLGVKTVGDLLDADPKAIAQGLGDRRINARLVAQWRDQARLLTRAPGLKPAHAVMLVACGYRDLASIAAASPSFLREQMAAAALSDPVKRALWGASPPDLEATKEIVENAKSRTEAA